jgi:tetratricopeptide (TPR) repeat protein
MGCATTSQSSTLSPDVDLPKTFSSSDDMALFRQYYEKGRNSGMADRLDEALEYFRKAEKLRSDDEKLLFDIGITFKRLGRYDEALKYFHRVFQINPYSFPAIGNIGFINKELSRYPEAIDALSKLLEIKPRDEGAIVSLADIYFKTKDYDKCREYILLFREAVEKNYIKALYERDQNRIKEVMDRFDVYMTAIEREKGKK